MSTGTHFSTFSAGLFPSSLHFLYLLFLHFTSLFLPELKPMRATDHSRKRSEPFLPLFCANQLLTTQLLLFSIHPRLSLSVIFVSQSVLTYLCFISKIMSNNQRSVSFFSSISQLKLNY